MLLEALQLDSLLPRMEVDTSLYITNRARLEQMYPYLPQEEGMVAEVVYSVLKHAVSEEEEARAVISPRFLARLASATNSAS